MLQCSKKNDDFKPFDQNLQTSVCSPVLNISNLTVHLQGRCILHNVTLDIAHNEFVAILGDNGAGKSTLLSSILGLARPTSGIIRLFGQQISWRNRRAVKHRIGYVPQSLPIDDTMPISGREVIAIGRCAKVGPGRRLTTKDHAIIEQAADVTGVRQLMDRPFGHLSGGERQKIQIARAICQQPELLLLDEVTSHLSSTAQQDCLQLLERLHLQNLFAILMVTHNVSAIPAHCRRAIVLDKGQKHFDGPLNEWRSKNRDNCA